MQVKTPNVSAAADGAQFHLFPGSNFEVVHADARRDKPFAARCKSDFAVITHPRNMTTLDPLRFWQIAAVLVAAFVPEIARAQEKANQGNLNVGGRRLVFKYVVAVRGKSYGENRMLVLATGQPVTAGVLKK